MKFLDVDDIADMLKLNPDHVRDRLTKQKGFPDAYRVGNVLRWDADDVTEWIKKQAVSPAARRSRPPARRSRKEANSSQSAQPSAPTA